MLKLSLIYYNDVAGVPSSNLAMGSFRGDHYYTSCTAKLEWRSGRRDAFVIVTCL